VAQQDEQIERMCATMKAAGIRCQGLDESDKLDQAQLNRLVD
jgi:serine O-acetyltransferase